MPHSSLGLDGYMICNLYMNLISVSASWSISLRMLYLHMCVQQVVLVGFLVIVVIILTLWMLRYRCGCGRSNLVDLAISLPSTLALI
jgi:hypothetical protein